MKAILPILILLLCSCQPEDRESDHTSVQPPPNSRSRTLPAVRLKQDPLLLRFKRHFDYLGPEMPVGDPHKQTEYLCILLHSDEIHKRQIAAEILGALCSPTATAALVEALRDSNEEVRHQARMALRNTINKHPSQIRSLRQGLSDPDPSFRKEVNVTLAMLPMGKSSTADLAGMADPDPQVQVAAIMKAIHSKDARANPILAKLLNSENQKVAETAAQALSRIDTPEVGRQILPLLQTGSPEVRIRVLRALALMKSIDSVPHLAQAMADPDLRVRQRAAYWLNRSPEVRAVPALIHALESETDFALQRDAAEALGKLKSAEAENALIHALKQQDNILRARCIRALGKLRSIQAIRPIVALVGADNRELAETIATALVEIGDAATPDLIQAITASDPQTQAVAMGILAKIDGPNAVAFFTSPNQLRNDEFLSKAYAYYLRNFQPSHSQMLIKALNSEHGNVKMASAMVKHSSPEIRSAVKTWAEKKGYQIQELVVPDR